MLQEKEPLATRSSVIQYKKLRKSPSTPQVEVQKYEVLKEVITTFHTEKCEPILWAELANTPPPFTGEIGPNETKIKTQIKNYKPTWRDRLFNRVEARIQYWKGLIPEDRQKDAQLMEHWKEQKQLAERILANDLNAWIHAIKMAQPSKEVTAYKNQIDYYISPNQTMIANVKLNHDVVLDTKYSLTKTGKLSKRNMPKKEYYQLFQQYTYSCFSRVAIDIFDTLPIDTVLIHIDAYSTADEGYGCILSAKAHREDIVGIRNYPAEQLEAVIEKLEHQQKFLKTKGFKVIKEVTE